MLENVLENMQAEKIVELIEQCYMMHKIKTGLAFQIKQSRTRYGERLVTLI